MNWNQSPKSKLQQTFVLSNAADGSLPFLELGCNTHVPGVGGVLHFAWHVWNATWILGEIHAGEANRWAGGGVPCIGMGLLQSQRLQVHTAYDRALPKKGNQSPDWHRPMMCILVFREERNCTFSECLVNIRVIFILWPSEKCRLKGITTLNRCFRTFQGLMLVTTSGSV